MTGPPFDRLRVTGFNGAYPLITYAKLNRSAATLLKEE
jgi:hypothetical protein